MLVYDITKQETFDDLPKWMKMIDKVNKLLVVFSFTISLDKLCPDSALCFLSVCLRGSRASPGWKQAGLRG